MALEAFDVKDRTVVITGAARGIGRGIAQVLAESGARVLVTSLTDRYLGPWPKRRQRLDARLRPWWRTRPRPKTGSAPWSTRSAVGGTSTC